MMVKKEKKSLGEMFLAQGVITQKQWDEAAQTIETMALFAPGHTDLWREAGLLYARLERNRDAVRMLEEYMRRTGAEDARYKTSVLLQELQARLN